MKRPHGVLFLAMGVLTLVAAAYGVQGLVWGEASVAEGRGKGMGPPLRVWTFTGREATRVGLGALPLTAGFGLMLLNMALARRGVERAWRTRVGAVLALLSLATLILFPPWQIRGVGILAAFWAFLAPALAGVLAGGGRRAALGVAAGALLAWAAGREETMPGLMGAFFAFGFVGGHVSFLLHPGFRAWLLNGFSAGDVT
jgi:hypothetical protein